MNINGRPMSTGLSFAVGHEQLKIFQKLVTELGHAPLGRLYDPELVPWGMFLYHNIVELSVSWEMFRTT